MNIFLLLLFFRYSGFSWTQKTQELFENATAEIPRSKIPAMLKEQKVMIL